MSTLSRRALIGSATLGIVGIGLLRPALAMIEMSRLAGVAVSGYDPVAYFTEGKPRPGSESITLMHQGVEWRFASTANRDLFKANPAKYAPQYGGFCSWAVAQGYTAPADPQAWAVHQGKLYLNYNLEVRERWKTDIPGHISKANVNWPNLSKAP
ncbi:MAG: YHS domain protein [Methylobacterium sp.]|nr:MAG: YHS domain protein [Methylobacterium sp.]